MPKPQPPAPRGAPAPRSALGRPLVRTDDRITEVRTLVAGFAGKMGALLPKTLPTSRMLQLVMNEVSRTPDLLECSRNSLIGCVLQVSQLGLELGGVLGEAHLIPRNNRKRGHKEVTLVIGYRGLMKLARRSGEVAFLDAHSVVEGDFFDWEMGSSRFLRWKPAPSPDRSEDPARITHAWAMAMLRTTSERPFEVLDRPKIERARQTSSGSGDSPWVTHYDEMARKTVVRSLCKWLPADALQAAALLDERADLGIAQDLDATWEVAGPEGQAVGGGDAAPAELEAGSSAEAPAAPADPADSGAAA